MMQIKLMMIRRSDLSQLDGKTSYNYLLIRNYYYLFIILIRIDLVAKIIRFCAFVFFLLCQNDLSMDYYYYTVSIDLVDAIEVKESSTSKFTNRSPSELNEWHDWSNNGPAHMK